MIAYGISATGTSHLERGVPCQDSFWILPSQERDGTWVAAVADGVGSCANAREGSLVAAREAASFCARCLPVERDLPNVYSMVRTAMNWAFKEVTRQAERDGQPLESYDTTLTLAIFDGTRVVYGHCGDGGLFVLTRDGYVEEVTTPQHGRDGVTVLPLREGYRGWQIGTYDGDVASVLLVTDGMRSALVPGLLQLDGDDKPAGRHGVRAARGGAPSGQLATPADTAGRKAGQPRVYESLARLFADPAGMATERGGEERGAEGEDRLPTEKPQSDADEQAQATCALACDDGDDVDPAFFSDVRDFVVPGGALASGRTAVPDGATIPASASVPDGAPVTGKTPGGEPGSGSTGATEGPSPSPSPEAPYARLGRVFSERLGAGASARLAEVRASRMPDSLVGAVRDDRSVCVLANPHAPVAPRVWDEPEWERLRASWRRLAYPSLRQV